MTNVPTDKTFARLEKIKKACLEHVKDLIESARILENSGMPHLAYHMATIALEEFGKLELARMNEMAADDENSAATGILSRHGDDHVRKLFWALWAPIFNRWTVSKQEIEELRGLSKEIHERRLSGLYLNLGQERIESPRSAVTKEHLGSLINLAELRLQAESATKYQEPSEERRSLMEWFLAAKDDQDKSKVIFGSASLRKLEELGTAYLWIKWLKEQFDKAEAEAMQMAKDELARPKPQDAQVREPKWKFRVRLVSSTHSIRSKALNWWNDGVINYKLKQVGSRKNEMDVEFYLPKGVHVNGVYNAGRLFYRNILLGLNIGTFGLFWRNPPMDQTKYYDTVFDLERPGAELRIEDHRLAVEVRKSALKVEDMQRVVVILGGLLHLRMNGIEDPFAKYLAGIAFLVKTDVNMDFIGPAFQGFCRAFTLGTVAFSDRSEDVKFEDHFEKFLREEFPEMENTQILRFKKLAENVEELAAVEPPVTPDEAWSMKALCDTYFNGRFRKLLRDKIAIKKREGDGTRS